ncbi:hypothetical protein CDAR_207831 [Caerostris darwini]|uniref:Cilia- and flagella-associated protein 97 n=1 Tax=Caerostris darwini TaxID=1538125 RepID=A0AAV4U3E7_9ARAC|nr:hypothetical protein CDAR_207831 [Caerostris darwini]
MSLRVGLGASQADLDVQGEIDFDFFDESDSTDGSNHNASPDLSSANNISEHCSIAVVPSNHSVLKGEQKHSGSDPYSLNIVESCSSLIYDKPLITVSCDDATGVVQKTTIEAVIPTPFTYKDNKCGKVSPSKLKKKKALSPRFKSKVFMDENDVSDDSSISSMSSSESVSSVSEDSFELNDSDSMTDVSSLESPYNCYTPIISDENNKAEINPGAIKEIHKDGVKFMDDVDKKQCAKCNSIDFHELVNAMNRLQMKQNANSVCATKCESPIITHNAKCRKNFSFSNEKVRKIDNDNQVLLKKIMAQQNRVKSHNVSAAPIRSSSAVNRHRHQRQIEMENLALLKRLESTKPSRNLSRSYLLRDYDRRSSGMLSRASSRSSYPNSCQASLRSCSSLSSGHSSAVGIKSSSSTAHTSLRSRSATTTN